MVKKYLHSPKPGFLYVRVRGKYLGRITPPSGSQEFDQQYWQNLSGRTEKCAISWSSLVASYRQSDRWTGLKPRSRADYEKVLFLHRGKEWLEGLYAITSKGRDCGDANKSPPLPLCELYPAGYFSSLRTCH